LPDTQAHAKLSLDQGPQRLAIPEVGRQPVVPRTLAQALPPNAGSPPGGRESFLPSLIRSVFSSPTMKTHFLMMRNYLCRRV
jgi:hypothetical protein